MLFLYITCKDIDEAKRIGRALLEKHVAAAVNVAPIESMYALTSGIKEVSEASLIVKTVDGKVQQVEDIVRGMHSYNIPCVASFALFRLNREYKDWMMSTVA